MTVINYNSSEDIFNFKACTKCSIVKRLEAFSRSKRKKDGRRSNCKECATEESKLYRLENSEKIKECNKKWRHENWERQLYTSRQWYAKNSERLLDKCKQWRIENLYKVRESEKRWYKENREKTLERQKLFRKTEAGRKVNAKARHTRRAREKGATIENFNSQDVFARDKWICQSCGIKTRPDYKDVYHPKYPNLDHIIPLSLGGEHSKRNTQCLCRKCNLGKGSRHANDQLLLIG